MEFDVLLPVDTTHAFPLGDFLQNVEKQEQAIKLPLKKSKALTFLLLYENSKNSKFKNLLVYLMYPELSSILVQLQLSG